MIDQFLVFLRCASNAMQSSAPLLSALFRLVQDLGHFAPPAKEIVCGADRYNQDRAHAVDQGENQSPSPPA